MIALIKSWGRVSPEPRSSKLLELEVKSPYDQYFEAPWRETK